MSKNNNPQVVPAPGLSGGQRDAITGQTVDREFTGTDPAVTAALTLNNAALSQAALETQMLNGDITIADLDRDKYAVIENIHQLPTDPETVDREVEMRAGLQEISNASAVHIARTLADSAGYEALECLGYEGYADKDAVRAELAEAYKTAWNPRVKGRINAMFTYLIHGADTVAPTPLI